MFQKLSILLVLLFYIATTVRARPQSVAEHTIDIHIPIAIPLDNVEYRPTQANHALPLTTPKSSVNNIYDQFTANSDFNYDKTGKRLNQEHSDGQNHVSGQDTHETSKKVGAEYLDKGKLYFRKVKKNANVSLDLKRLKKHSSNKSNQTQHYEHNGGKYSTYEVYESQKTNDGHLSHDKDLPKGQTSREILKTNLDGAANVTRSTSKWRDKKHGRNIINVLRTRKVRKSHLIGENNCTTSDDFTYPKISPVYVPNDKNNIKINKTNENDAKRNSHGKDNSTLTDSKLSFPMTTANYHELDNENYSIPAPKVASTESYPKHFKHESRNRRRHNPTIEKSKKKQESNSSTYGLKERSSDSTIERYEPIVFRYEDYPFQAQNFSRNNFSNLARFHNSYVNILQNRRQQYENLLANDGNQQGDDYLGGKAKKHGKRGFKIINDLVSLITGNNGPPPKRYRGHIIGSDGYVFENNPFGNSQALSLASQGLTLKDNGFSFTNGNNHNFGLTAFGNSKDLGQSFSFSSDGTNGHSLSLVNGNHAFGTTGVGSDPQKISFGTSANGDTFSFANLKDPKTQVESVFSGNSQPSVQKGASENIRIVTKEVPVPYPVHVEKKVPYFIRVPHDRAVPYPVHKPYPVHITKPVPYPVKVHVPAPYPVTVEKHIPFPVKISVPRPVAVHIPRPYPVYIEKKVPYTVEKPVPYAVKVPYERPVPVPITVEKPVPYAVTKHVPFPVKIPVEKPFPLTIPKPYPITVEKPVKVPYKVPVPISINFPNKNEQFNTGVDPNTNTGNPTGFGTNTGGSADFGANTGTTAFGGNLRDVHQENFANLNNAQQNNFPQQFYSQENTNSDVPGYDVNNDGSIDYGDTSNVGLNNAENVQNGFGNTAAGYDTANNFGNNQGAVQADLPNINTIKVPEVNQNYQIYFDGTRQHKHKQTQDIFNEVNNVFDNLESKAVVPNFDQVGHIQHGRQNNAGRAMKPSTPGFRGTARFTESHTERSIGSHKFPSTVELAGQNQFSAPLTQNQYNSNESGRYNSAEANVGKSQFPGSQEYNKIDYALLGGSFESHQSESENHSS